MTWPLEPGAASGPVRLGATRAEVRAALGEPTGPRGGGHPTDRYDDVHVHYDGDDRCAAVEVWPEVAPTLDSVDLLTTPYAEVVGTLRARDPLAIVDADGTTALAAGVGVSAPAGVHAPFEPADSVIVFAPGYYGDLFSLRPPPRRCVVRAMPFVELTDRLGDDGWTARVLDSFAPLVPGEPETAQLNRDGEVVRAFFDPVVELRWLDLGGCSPESGRAIASSVPTWAAVDSAVALVSAGSDHEVLWGLVLAELLDDPKLSEHVIGYIDDLRPLISEAALKATRR